MVLFFVGGEVRMTQRVGCESFKVATRLPCPFRAFQTSLLAPAPTSVNFMLLGQVAEAFQTLRPQFCHVLNGRGLAVPEKATWLVKAAKRDEYGAPWAVWISRLVICTDRGTARLQGLI